MVNSVNILKLLDSLALDLSRIQLEGMHTLMYWLIGAIIVLGAMFGEE